jgi:hypothetical protein
MKPKFWDNETPLLISFSGGKSSALMLRLIQLHYGLDDCVVLFANTGKENPETLDFVEDVQKNWGIDITWLEAVINPEYGVGVGFRVVTPETCSRNGEPFKALIKKYGLPSRMNRMCTGNLKIKPMEKYMRHLGYKKWVSAIGIRADEPKRLKDKFYPLAAFGIDTDKVIKFWEAQAFTLDLPSYAGNCDLCHLKSLSKRIKCIERKPEIAHWWKEMEDFANDVFDNAMPVNKIEAAAHSRKNQIELDFSTSEVDLHCVCDSL